MAEMHRCEGEDHDGRFGYSQCLGISKVKRGDKWYCDTHDPVKVKERTARYKAGCLKERVMREHKAAQAANYRALYEAGKSVTPFILPDFGIAIDELKAALAEYERLEKKGK